MISAKQRHRLLSADRSRDPATIAAAVRDVLAASPDLTAGDCEQALRDGACHAFLLAAEGGFEVVVGFARLADKLAAAGSTPAKNRAALAALRQDETKISDISK